MKKIYNNNRNELLFILILIIIFNFMCPQYNDYTADRKVVSIQHTGGQMMGMPGMPPKVGLSSKITSFVKSVPGGIMNAPGKGLDAIRSGAKAFDKANTMQSLLGWLYSLVKSFISFAMLLLTLAILPGLPVFIFMLILFFILRSRVANLKSL